MRRHGDWIADVWTSVQWQFLLSLYTNQFLVFLLVLTRVSGLVMLAPVWGSRAIPMRVRAFLAIGIALIVSPLLWNTPIEDPGNLLHLVVLVGCEFAVGLSLGLAVMIYFAGLELAGQVMGQMTGMSLADVASPDFDASVPVFSQFLHLLMLSIFVITGGHQYVLDALFQMFQQMPPGHTHFSTLAGRRADRNHDLQFHAGPAGGGADDGRPDAVHPDHGPDQPHAAAAERPGGRLQRELDHHAVGHAVVAGHPGPRVSGPEPAGH